MTIRVYENGTNIDVTPRVLPFSVAPVLRQPNEGNIGGLNQSKIAKCKLVYIQQKTAVLLKNVRFPLKKWRFYVKGS